METLPIELINQVCTYLPATKILQQLSICKKLWSLRFNIRYRNPVLFRSVKHVSYKQMFVSLIFTDDDQVSPDFTPIEMQLLNSSNLIITPTTVKKLVVMGGIAPIILNYGLQELVVTASYTNMPIVVPVTVKFITVDESSVRRLAGVEALKSIYLRLEKASYSSFTHYQVVHTLSVFDILADKNDIVVPDNIEYFEGIMLYPTITTTPSSKLVRLSLACPTIKLNIQNNLNYLTVDNALSVEFIKPLPKSIQHLSIGAGEIIPEHFVCPESVQDLVIMGTRKQDGSFVMPKLKSVQLPKLYSVFLKFEYTGDTPITIPGSVVYANLLSDCGGKLVLEDGVEQLFISCDNLITGAIELPKTAKKILTCQCGKTIHEKYTGKIQFTPKEKLPE